MRVYSFNHLVRLKDGRLFIFSTGYLGWMQSINTALQIRAMTQSWEVVWSELVEGAHKRSNIYEVGEDQVAKHSKEDVQKMWSEFTRWFYN